MIIFLIYFLFLAEIILSLKSLKLGLYLYLAIRLVLPTTARLGSISLNSACILVVLTIFFLKEKMNIRKTSLFPFPLLVLPLFLLGLFAKTPISFQFSELMQFTLTELIPFFLMLNIIRDEDKNRCCQLIYISFIIIGIYGIISFFLPYNILYMSFYDIFRVGTVYEISDEALSMGALNGRATGNTSGGIIWGQICLIVTSFALFDGDSNKRLRNAVVFLGSLNCLLCTKRSALVPLTLILLIYLLQRLSKINLKSIAVILSMIMAALILQRFFPDIFERNVIAALKFWDDRAAESAGLHGSTFNMRMEQATYLNQMISSCALQGFGFNYPTYYVQVYHGIHPFMLGFESIYFSAVASSGYIGFIVWMFFFLRIYKKTTAINRQYRYVHLTYIISIFMSGIQSTLWLYLVIVALRFLKEARGNRSNVQTVNID